MSNLLRDRKRALYVLRNSKPTKLAFQLIHDWPLPFKMPISYKETDSRLCYLVYANFIKTVRECFTVYYRGLREAIKKDEDMGPILSIKFRDAHIARSGLCIDHALESLRFNLPLRARRLASVDTSGYTTFEWETEWNGDLVHKFKSRHSEQERRDWHLLPRMRERMKKDHNLWVDHCLYLRLHYELPQFDYKNIMMDQEYARVAKHMPPTWMLERDNPDRFPKLILEVRDKAEVVAQRAYNIACKRKRKRARGK